MEVITMVYTVQQAAANYEKFQTQIAQKIEASIDIYLSSYFRGQKKIRMPIDTSHADQSILEMIVDHYEQGGWLNIEIMEDTRGVNGWLEMEYDPDYQKDENKPEHDKPEGWVYKR
jgi:hypothetical protein